jgi:hypothetical protein
MKWGQGALGALPLLLVCFASCSPVRTGTVPKKEDITAVLSRHTPELMKIDGVVGTGEGREGETPIIVVFVRQKTDALARKIPREIEGWKVVVREVGEVTAPPSSR